MERGKKKKGEEKGSTKRPIVHIFDRKCPEGKKRGLMTFKWRKRASWG